MKIRRYKKVHKSMSFYENNFGFRQPYQMLIDGTFCYTALNNKVNIADNIPRYLHSELKILTTQCAVIEMENLGPKLNGALLILKQFGVHKCGHEGKPVAGAKCLLSMLGKNNENHYIVGTQDRDLQDRLRNIPGVPLLFLHSKTPVLELPSPASRKYVNDKSSGLLEVQRWELELLKQKHGIVEEEIKIKKKKKKGPNPLSCKKKKSKPKQTSIVKKESKPEIEKKKRKRIKIPQHVKEVLLNKDK